MGWGGKSCIIRRRKSIGFVGWEKRWEGGEGGRREVGVDRCGIGEDIEERSGRDVGWVVCVWMDGGREV